MAYRNIDEMKSADKGIEERYHEARAKAFFVDSVIGGMINVHHTTLGRRTGMKRFLLAAALIVLGAALVAGQGKTLKLFFYSPELTDQYNDMAREYKAETGNHPGHHGEPGRLRDRCFAPSSTPGTSPTCS